MYIDLNMVRTGVVSHPGDWDVCGFREIQSPPARYRVIVYSALLTLLSIPDIPRLQQIHRDWIEEGLKTEPSRRDDRWSRSLAIGSQPFVAQFQSDLGICARHRGIEGDGASHTLREGVALYTTHSAHQIAALSADNVWFLDESV